MDLTSSVKQISKFCSQSFEGLFSGTQFETLIESYTSKKIIPKFPDFANVTPELKVKIESFTHKFEPYSDFNFYSLYSWDTMGNRKISVLNNNLVAQMTDYKTGQILLSFIGTNRQTETVKTLIKYAQKLGISDSLQYVPEISISEISDSTITITEERSDFDYIFLLEDIAKLKGRKYSKIRQLTNVFNRNNPDAIIVHEDLDTLKSSTKILEILENWQKNKLDLDKECDLEHEPVAINRLLEMKDKSKLMVSYIILNGDAIAFSIDEILPNKYALAHYSKFDMSYKGINEYLNFKIANELIARGAELWNWEQDLDVKNLRYSKMSYSPVKFMKKYSVTLK